MAMELRPYQKESIEKTYKFFEDNPKKTAVVVAPTGSGKTAIILQLCRDMIKWNCRVLIVTHIKELIGQTADLLEEEGLDVGIYSAGLKRRDTKNQIIVAGVQSIANRGLELSGTNPFNLVIVDEVHRMPVDKESTTRYAVLWASILMANPYCRLVGLTATAFRTKEGWICSETGLLNAIAHEVDIVELIEDGFLSPLTSKRADGEANMQGVRKMSGDFANGEMTDRFMEDGKVALAVEEIIAATVERKKVLIFCCNIEHAIAVAEEFGEQGHPARLVTSEHGGRDKSVMDFKNDPDCRFLVNVNIFCEGFNVPAVDCVVLLRATLSPGLYVQMVGRGLRIFPEKLDCQIMDFGGNVQRHGLLTSLNITDRPDSNGDGEAPVKPCPECNELVHAAIRICPVCGFEFPEKEPNHESRSSGDNPLGGPLTTTYDVTNVTYLVHQKKGYQEGDPRTLRVTYFDGFAKIVAEEWVCLEHTGFAYEKAQSWWYSRTDSFEHPETIEEAVEYAETEGIREPSKITVKETPGERFPKIMGYILQDAVSAEEALDEIDEDIPF